MRRHAFTLVEVLAALLLVAIGIASVVGLLNAGVRQTAAVQAQALQQITANALVHAAIPVGSTAMGLNNGRGWEQKSASGTVLSPGYTIVHHGYVNGFYAIRTEISTIEDAQGRFIDPVEVAASSSRSPIADANERDRLTTHWGDPSKLLLWQRWAEVQVDLYAGMDGAYISTVRRRIVRRLP
jgi:prepilin-type N-terminal cleavage/methylation domain-containing protein